MGMPNWWGARRYGVAIHASLATVPGWAPIGQDVHRYRRHIAEPSTDVEPSEPAEEYLTPLAEVLAHHRDRWGHIDHYDDFVPLLTFERFDAEEWARLVVDAGAGHSTVVARERDGWCWWDAPATDRSTVRRGPARNVLGEYAAACERNDLVFGVSYAPVDWGADPASGRNASLDVSARQLRDLVERYGASMLRGVGSSPSEILPSDERFDELLSIDPQLVVDDRLFRSSVAVRAVEHSVPDRIVETPWEFRTTVGASVGFNRVDRPEHHASGYDLVALLTEVVAKGGHLLVDVGPDASGHVSEMQSRPLRDAGSWVRRYGDVLARSRPWSTWGDDDVRFLDVDGVLHAVDLSGRGRLDAVVPTSGRVTRVVAIDGGSDDQEIRFVQGDRGLELDVPGGARQGRRGRNVDIATYRIERAIADRPVELFAPEPRVAIELAPLLDGVSPGDIIQLGDGTYTGPVTLPSGIVLRGLGAGRTVIESRGACAVSLERNARLEYVTVRVTGDGDRHRSDALAAVHHAGPFSTVLGCTVEGTLLVTADSVQIRASSLNRIVADGADRVTVSRCELSGTGWDVGITLSGGGEHDIDSCEIHGHLCAVRATDTTGTVVRGTNISARWWGIHLCGTERAHLHGNFVSNTMRAFDIDGGTQALIDGNAVCDGDSGCVVERGASGCQVSGNSWERCRIGLLAWDALGVHQQDNRAIDLHEPDHATIFGP